MNNYTTGQAHSYFQKHLGKYLNDSKMKKATLAHLCSVSSATITAWLNGEIMPGWRHFVRLSEIFGVAPEKFIAFPGKLTHEAYFDLFHFYIKDVPQGERPKSHMNQEAVRKYYNSPAVHKAMGKGTSRKDFNRCGDLSKAYGYRP